MQHWLDGDITAALDHLLRPGELRRRQKKWVILINDTWRKGAMEQVSFQPTPDAPRQVMANKYHKVNLSMDRAPLSAYAGCFVGCLGKYQCKEVLLFRR
jgi:hypothetical protein